MVEMSAREFIDQEMRRELLARKTALRLERDSLQQAAVRIRQIDEALAIIDTELAAYGYAEEPKNAVPAPAG